MKERPILFSAPMVRALLNGSKTQTRRIVKPQPDVVTDDGFAGRFTPRDAELGRLAEVIRCPYGHAGDRLWVRECFSKLESFEFFNSAVPKVVPDFWYWADGNPEWGDWTRPKPSIHMPRIACRIELEIVGVRVERLQAISRADAIAEGAPPSHPSIDKVSREFGYEDFSGSWYGQLWESINGAGSWNANPYVWVIEFKRAPNPGVEHDD